MLIQAVQSAIGFVKAGNYADRRDYARARVHIQRAMEAAGPRLKKRGLFEYFMRAAQIEEKLGNAEAAYMYIRDATDRISAYKRLSKQDRKYLLDYCDVLAAEVRGVRLPLLRLTRDEYQQVTARYRQLYPLKGAYP